MMALTAAKLFGISRIAFSTAAQLPGQLEQSLLVRIGLLRGKVAGDLRVYYINCVTIAFLAGRHFFLGLRLLRQFLVN